ncbi:MAG: serine hydrolase [Bacilli bacterium]|nr:serine hydrolase [Bacilli bacterium]MDD4547185.1 serine hydrolase [Bacilli bacterium]
MNDLCNIIQNKMNEGVSDNVFPGSTYAIIHKGNIIMDVVGYKSLYPIKEENRIDTIYDLASLTKVLVTNTLIGKLLEDKIIDLDDLVKKYIKEFKHDDITIKDLLTHSSGLPANVNWMHIKTREEYLDLILNVEKVIPRHSKALYSDIGFIILGILIERITNESLDNLANKHIFKKLEMYETTYNPIEIERCAPTELEGETYVKGYVHDRKARLFNGVAGHAGVFSTVSDLIKFAQLILNEGVYKGNQIISKEIIELWYQPTFIDDTERYRTIGWIEGKRSTVCDYISSKAMYHQGFTGNRLLIDKGNDLAIIILSNRVHPTRNNNAFGEFFGEVTTLIYENLIVNNH